MAENRLKLANAIALQSMIDSGVRLRMFCKFRFVLIKIMNRELMNRRITRAILFCFSWKFMTITRWNMIKLVNKNAEISV